ncbi:hypothetical protein PR048_015047 [Dryococelus australis]|uniref:Uncharacterized protein n=1 Tax=Dryococelus australis TaxID=614101 RepID=A0ABQ9HG50_9NEOP|nr:hypothetical protein PR048_015047 [Dryococelus australis]
MRASSQLLAVTSGATVFQADPASLSLYFPDTRRLHLLITASSLVAPIVALFAVQSVQRLPKLHPSNDGCGISRGSLIAARGTWPQKCSLYRERPIPPGRTSFDFRRGRSRIFACRNRAVRCRWSTGFLGELQFPPPLHSGAAPYLAPPPSALKTSLLRAAQISYLTLLLLLQMPLYQHMPERERGIARSYAAIRNKYELDYRATKWLSTKTNSNLLTASFLTYNKYTARRICESLGDVTGLQKSTVAGGWARTMDLHHYGPMRYPLHHDEAVRTRLLRSREVTKIISRLSAAPVLGELVVGRIHCTHDIVSLASVGSVRAQGQWAVRNNWFVVSARRCARGSPTSCTVGDVIRVVNQPRVKFPRPSAVRQPAATPPPPPTSIRPDVCRRHPCSSLIYVDCAATLNEQRKLSSWLWRDPKLRRECGLMCRRWDAVFAVVIEGCLDDWENMKWLVTTEGRQVGHYLCVPLVRWESVFPGLVCTCFMGCVVSRCSAGAATTWTPCCGPHNSGGSVAFNIEVLRADNGEVKNARAGKNGRSRENPPTSGIVRHDSHMRKSGTDPARNRTRLAVTTRREAYVCRKSKGCSRKSEHFTNEPWKKVTAPAGIYFNGRTGTDSDIITSGQCSAHTPQRRASPLVHRSTASILQRICPNFAPNHQHFDAEEAYISSDHTSIVQDVYVLEVRQRMLNSTAVSQTLAWNHPFRRMIRRASPLHTTLLATDTTAKKGNDVDALMAETFKSRDGRFARHISLAQLLPA